MTASLSLRAEFEYDDQAAVVAIGQLERLRLLTTDPGVKHPDSNGWAWTEPHPDPQPRAISTTPTLMQAVKNGREFGFATGQPARGGNLGYACVIDVDPRNGGEDSLHDLTGEYGMPHRYPQHTTPSGGWHYLARSPVFLPSFVLAPGVEVKAARGFVKSPPSPGYVPVGNLELDYLAPLPDVLDWIPDLAQLAPSPAERDAVMVAPADADTVLLAVYTTHAGARAGERFYGHDVSSARFRAFTWAKDGRVSYDELVQAILMGWRDNPAGPPTSQQRAGKPATERELRLRLRAEFRRAKSTAELLLLSSSSAAQEASPNRTSIWAELTAAAETAGKHSHVVWDKPLGKLRTRASAVGDEQSALGVVVARCGSWGQPPFRPLAASYVAAKAGMSRDDARRALARLAERGLISQGEGDWNPGKRATKTYRPTALGLHVSERRSA